MAEGFGVTIAVSNGDGLSLSINVRDTSGNTVWSTSDTVSGGQVNLSVDETVSDSWPGAIDLVSSINTAAGASSKTQRYERATLKTDTPTIDIDGTWRDYAEAQLLPTPAIIALSSSQMTARFSATAPIIARVRAVDAETGAVLLSPSDTGYSTSKIITLSGLDADTLYSVRVIGQDQAGNTVDDDPLALIGAVRTPVAPSTPTINIAGDWIDYVDNGGVLVNAANGWPAIPAAETVDQGAGLISGAYFGGGVLTSNGGTANDHAIGQIALMTGNLVGFFFHNRVDSNTGDGITDPWVYALTQTHGGYAAGNGGTYRPEIRAFDPDNPDEPGGVILHSTLQYSPCDLGNNAEPTVRLSQPVPMTAGDKFWIRELNMTPVPDVDYGYASVARANAIGRTAGWRSRNGRRMHTTHADDTARFGALGGGHHGRFLYRDSPLDGFGSTWQEWTRDRPILGCLMERDGVEYRVGDIYASYDDAGYDDPQWERTVAGSTLLRQRFTEVNATRSYRTIALYHGHETAQAYSALPLTVSVRDLASGQVLATGTLQPSSACYAAGSSARRHAIVTMSQAWTQVQGRQYAFELSAPSGANWYFNSYILFYYQPALATAASDADAGGTKTTRDSQTSGVAEVSTNGGNSWTGWGAYRQATRDLGIYAIRDGVQFDASGAIFGGEAGSGTTPPPPVPTIVGRDFANFHGSAYRIGWSGLRGEIAFAAEHDGNMDGIRLHWRFGTEGTGIGDGGEIRVRIVNDDFGLPGSTVFSERTFEPGIDGSGHTTFFGVQPSLNNVSAPSLSLTPVQPLVKGDRYHVVLENIAADAADNYIAFNGMGGRVGDEPTPGFFGSQYGSAEQYRMTARTTAGDAIANDNKAAVQLEYSSGAVQGYGVYAGRFDVSNYIEGVREIRQPIQVDETVSVAVARLMVGRVSGTGALTMTITDSGGTVLATDSVDSGSIPLQQTRIGYPCGDHAWIEFDGINGFDFVPGQTYYATLSAPSGTRYFQYAGRTEPAWDARVRGFLGETAQIDDGNGWAGWIDGAARRDDSNLGLHFAST